MGIVFLSYRRNDSAATCERVYDRLVAAFGKTSVFMDVNAIPGGVQFPQYLEDAIEASDAQIVVIGPQWLDATGPNGRRRLDDPSDFVRHEIESALQRSIPVIPVLVEGAAMPRADQLPESLRNLASRSAIVLRRNPDFDGDIHRLVAALTALRRDQRQAGSPVYMVFQTIVRSAFALAACAAALTLAIVLGIRPSFIGQALVIPISHYPEAAVAIIGLLSLATFSAVVLLRVGSPLTRDGVFNPGREWQEPRLIASVATSSLSTVVLGTLLVTMLLQPAWCPSALCPSPRLITRGIHDANLELYFTANQSAYYEIPASPSTYTLSDLPKQIGAVRIDQPNQPAYKEVIGIHSLQQGRFGMIIEQVRIVIDTVPVSPQPLDVWFAGEPVDYHTNPYQVTYIGQSAGAILNALYEPMPEGKVLLAPGESDELDIQVVSRVRADIRFQVSVVYRVSNESSLHTLVLPQQFEAVFADSTNWHLYQVENGSFVSSS